MPKVLKKSVSRKASGKASERSPKGGAKQSPAKGAKAAKPAKAAKSAKAADASKGAKKAPAKAASKTVAKTAVKTVAKPKAAPAKAAGKAKAVPKASAKGASKSVAGAKAPAKAKGKAVAGKPSAPAAGNGATEQPQSGKVALKQQFAKLSTATSQISGLKRSLPKSFFDVGTILNRIRDERLYEVKGYGSFESFVEREIDINKVVCLRTARIAEAINRDDALAAGLDRASAAVAALDGESEGAGGARPAGSPGASIPLHKQ